MRQLLRANKSLLRLTCLATSIVFFPLLVSNPYYLNVANIIGLNAIIVVGLTLLIGYAGQVSLGHAAFYGLGAYISAILTVSHGLNPWLALIMATLITSCIAVIIGIPTLKLQGHYLVMATLGFNLIANIIIVQWDSVTGGPSGFPGVPPLSVGSLSFDTDGKMYFLIWSFLFIVILLSLNLANSRVGRGLKALHAGESAANCVGIPTSAYKVKMFIFSAALASLAGSLYAHYLSFVSPKTFDIFFSVELVTMVIVGGMGSIWGGLFGTGFLTSLPNVLHYVDEYKDIIYGLILVLILIFVPEGLLVSASRRFRSRRDHIESDVLETDTQQSSENSFPWNNVPISSTRHSESDMMSREPILRVHNVSRGFGGVLAVSEVSFDIPDASVTSLIGPNGAGKTTIINLISGVNRSHGGRILFQERRIDCLRPYEIAGMGLTRTFQNVQVFDNMTVLENVMVGMHPKTKSEFLTSMLRPPSFRKEEKEIRDRSMESLIFLNLEQSAHTPASELSFGDQKRLEIARAIVSSPKLVLLDEPVAGLNMTESFKIADIILEMRSKGMSVLLVEHDINVVMRISDKVVVLDYGTKIADGSPLEVQNNRDVLNAYLGGVL